MPWIISGSGREPGLVRGLRAPHHPDAVVFVGRREDDVVHIEPVLLDRDHLGGVEIDAQVADGVVAGDGTPQGRGGGELHRLGRGLLVVAVPEGAVPRGPGVAGIGIEAAQEGEHRVVPVPGIGVPDEQVDHPAPVLLLGPLGVVHGDDRRGHDEVAPVEMMIVQLAGPFRRRTGKPYIVPHVSL